MSYEPHPIWPTHRRKRRAQRGKPFTEREEDTATLDEVALDLVERGLASKIILGPGDQTTTKDNR